MLSSSKFKTRKAITILPFFLLSLLLSAPFAYANVIGNQSFEDAIGNGTTGNWDDSHGADRKDTTFTIPFSGWAPPPAGEYGLYLITGTYTWQLYDNVKPGDYVTFSAKAQTKIAAGAGKGGQLKIQFKKILPDGSDVLIPDTEILSSLITTVNAPAADANPYVTFSIAGVAPPETSRVVFVLSREGAAPGAIIFDDVVGEVNPAKLSVTTTKSRVKAGEALPIFMQFTNDSGGTLANVEMVTELPHGFDVVGDSVRVDGHAADHREGSVIVPIGNMIAGQSTNVKFMVVVTRAVTPGHQYELRIRIRNSADLSETGFVRVLVDDDPVFDRGTIIGKVFNDKNQDGSQDNGEKGIPGVRLATEEGVVIITDKDGKYHLPGVVPGRHLVKIDGHTLPEGTKFITEESYLVKITPGILAKANFAVLLPPSAVPEQFQDELVVTMTQGLDTSRPDLSVKITPDVLKGGLGKLAEEPVFEFKLNYPEMVKSWSLEIRDELGREVWQGLGVGAPPPEVIWSGQVNNGTVVRPGVYSYQLKVEDKDARQDWTPLYFFKVISSGEVESTAKRMEISPIGDFNIFKDGKRSIPLVAKPTLHIQGVTKPDYQVTVNQYPVSIDGAGNFQTEIYTTPGQKEVVVVATSPDGEATTYRKTVKVKDSTFFMVALGEEQLGLNTASGNMQTIGNADPYKDGFYEDGRLSYYLRGKLKGKFLVKSHYDTADRRSALFTNMDPDDYYPIYGDASTRNYEDQDSLQKFYIVVEMDRSYVKWGSYKTEFNDTELAAYNRTLSGFKLSHETLATTPYGDPKRGFKVFMAKTKSRPSHDELAATGGSLYYLRRRNVIEGSEKLRVEVRDKIQDISVSSYDLKEGTDYEIDYREGRILLSRPLSSVAASDTLVSVDILDGSPVFLVADYEYDAGAEVFANADAGIRGYTHMGNHLRVGATAVDEGRQGIGNDYHMRGVDLTTKWGRNTKITAEYAETQREQTAMAISYNGGLSYGDRPVFNTKHSANPRKDAFLIKGQTKPTKNLEMAGYAQGFSPNYSTANTLFQSNVQKYGVAAKYKLHDNLNVRYRYDSNAVSDQIRPYDEYNLAAQYNDRKIHTLQTIYDDGKRLAEIEYQRNETDFPKSDPTANSLTGDLTPSLISEIPMKNGVAGKLGYHINEKLLPYVKVQSTVGGKANRQYGGGIRYEVVRNLFGYIEEMKGGIGDSTKIGFEKNHPGGARSYANIGMLDSGVGAKTMATAVGSSFSLSERSRVYSEREYSTYQGIDGYADIMGYDSKLGDHWDYSGKFERRNLSNQTTNLLDSDAASGFAKSNSGNTVSGALGYLEGDKFSARTTLELRYEQDVPNLRQWVSRNHVKYQVNKDLSYLGKLDYGRSRFVNPDNTPADFVEASTGFAYRPVDLDRLNILSRYTYLRNMANDSQFATPEESSLETDEIAHIVSVDLAYDLFRYLSTVEKVAYKRSYLATSATDPILIHNLLLAHRFNFHITRKWDVAAEYRVLWQSGAATNLRHGALAEVDREIYEYVKLGAGYNFSDFDDDLRKSSNYQSHGPFVRMTGKF